MEASSLSPNNRRGLSLLATDFDEEVFQELLVLAFAILTRQSGASEEHLTSSPKFASCDKVALKHAYAGLTTLLLEAAKADASAEDLTPVLEELSIVASRAELLARLYGAQKARVRDELGCTGFELPNLVDVSWRLDHQVLSSEAGKVSEPLYLVKFTTKDSGGGLRDIEFSCNRPQLADLLARVKDATKQVDRLVSNMSSQ